VEAQRQAGVARFGDPVAGFRGPVTRDPRVHEHGARGHDAVPVRGEDAARDPVGEAEVVRVDDQPTHGGPR
jgi:hypothetical protein